MEEIKKGKILEITVNELVEKYDYVDVERILHEMKNPLSDEECEERYKELFEY